MVLCAVVEKLDLISQYFEKVYWANTVVVHSRDDEEVGVAHEAKSPKNQL